MLHAIVNTSWKQHPWKKQVSIYCSKRSGGKSFASGCNKLLQIKYIDLKIYICLYITSIWSEYLNSYCNVQIIYIKCSYLKLLLPTYHYRVFHISVSWWFFTGVWVTASLLKSLGLVSGFWPFLAMLSFG